ncbi:MAG: ribonuclease III [Mycoplasmoidaceae bacterium]
MKRNKREPLIKLKEQLNLDKFDKSDIKLFEEAFTHSSYKNENKHAKDYERLEILGDAIVQKIVTELLYHQYPHYSEKDITEARKKIVPRETMAHAANELNLINYAFLGRGINLTKDAETKTIKSDLFESLIGAIYLTNGEDQCTTLIKQTIMQYQIDEIEDYKTKIQEIFQSSQVSKNNKNKSIFYKSEEKDGQFIATLYYKKIEYGVGTGKTKKKAEQNAAKAALLKYVPPVNK